MRCCVEKFPIAAFFVKNPRKKVGNIAQAKSVDLRDFVQSSECEKNITYSLTFESSCFNMTSARNLTEFFVSYYLFFLFLFVFPDKTRAEVHLPSFCILRKKRNNSSIFADLTVLLSVKLLYNSVRKKKQRRHYNA